MWLSTENALKHKYVQAIFLWWMRNWQKNKAIKKIKQHNNKKKTQTNKQTNKNTNTKQQQQQQKISCTN